MKKITKFLLIVTSVGSIVWIARLNLSQFAVMGQELPPLEPTSKPTTVSAGPRFIQPTEDRDPRGTLFPGTLSPEPGRVRGNCENFPQASFTALVPENKIA